MNYHQMIRLLREHGFAERRPVRHGTLWADAWGKQVLLAKRAKGREHRASRNFLAELKRAMRGRPGRVHETG